MAAHFVYFTVSQEWKPDAHPQDYRDGWAPVFAAICLTRVFKEAPDVFHDDWRAEARRKLFRGGRLDLRHKDLDPATSFFRGDDKICIQRLSGLFANAGGSVKLYQTLFPQHDNFHTDYVQERFPGATKTELTVTVAGGVWGLLNAQNLI